MPRYKAPEVPRNEAYIQIRRNDEELGKRRRWTFFSILLEIVGRFIMLGQIQPIDFIAFRDAQSKTLVHDL